MVAGRCRRVVASCREEGLRVIADSCWATHWMSLRCRGHWARKQGQCRWVEVCRGGRPLRPTTSWSYDPSSMGQRNGVQTSLHPLAMIAQESCARGRRGQGSLIRHCPSYRGWRQRGLVSRALVELHVGGYAPTRPRLLLEPRAPHLQTRLVSALVGRPLRVIRSTSWRAANRGRGNKKREVSLHDVNVNARCARGCGTDVELVVVGM